MEEPNALSREQGLIQKHFQHTLVLWVALFATLNITILSSVWLLKDKITADTMFLLPYYWMMTLYFVFTAYSVYMMLATETTPATKRSGHLLWWHGAGWVLAMAVGVVLRLAFGRLPVTGL